MPQPHRTHLRRSALAAALAVSFTASCRSGAPGGEAPGDTLPPASAPVAATTPPPAAPAQAQRAVVPGLEVLVRDSLSLLRGKRVGLITNQSAVTRSGELSADLLARTPGVQLVALFGPEHGIRGTAEAGETVAGGKDTRTGIPIFSLYDRTQRPTAEELANVDILLYDIQDIGARPYTFVWTMTMAMEEAKKRGIPFVVLDRPNPITEAVDGPVMDINVRNVTQVITGYYTVPLRHGMTSGEVAAYFNDDSGLGVDLHVIRAEGWRPDTWFEQTGLRWINPSPNIRSVDAALNFSGLVLAEGTNVHVGRGTDAPFSYIGAPWLDANRLLAAIAQYNLPGVRFVPTEITPTTDPAVDTQYKGTKFTTLKIEVTDRRAFRPVYTTLVVLTEAKRQNPGQFRVANTGFTQMIGSTWARAAFDRGEDPRVIQRRWDEEMRTWMQERDKYRFYR
ncbi:exo-beta-N-acetylmuramidase NamZ domain-containing protein [Longimicrobium terrae]|uniref:Uncharacterized protein YbbC (DUF1343 family) n=1 Tax=Longimicrobium terrae TaxID=1639882 RepID=A0A841H0I8_9BACT|nr:DUF1343 domain-containing protein [Longimicrobium terrae]MBB4637260.1 uncharacterized protein YbbC (DUF1343 family) [Longimicrobium terrae]MBB6071478.1 uncharacterized protein YbbC (DUF1343 family) [Longimicrobium terrae]NNC30099.1 DUF1343 domain-containing protein [Longimicrobium terrae]